MSNTVKELEKLKAVEFDAGMIFSGEESGRKITGYEKSLSFTPQEDKNYIFHDSSRDVVVWFMNTSDPLYLFGPTGSGKTSLIKQLASKLNYPVFEITGHSRLEYPDMIGHLSVENGNMKFQYGPLALAMKFGGLFLLNEIDLLDPATAAGLNTILDDAPLCVSENNGELINPHPNFRFAATANTNGASDETGLYQGTLRQNLAFLDRFQLCEVGYPKVEVATVAQSFLKFSEQFETHFAATDTYPLPKTNHTRFYIIKGGSVLTGEFKENDLVNEKLPLSPLFHKGHELISAIMLIEEQRQRD